MRFLALGTQMSQSEHWHERLYEKIVSIRSSE